VVGQTDIDDIDERRRLCTGCIVSSLEVYIQVTDDEQRVDKCSKTIEHVS